MHLHLSRLSAIKKNKVKGMEKGVCVCFFSVMSPFQLPKFCHERLFFCCLCLCEFTGLELTLTAISWSLRRVLKEMHVFNLPSSPRSGRVLREYHYEKMIFKQKPKRSEEVSHEDI